jgi:hypothetical protein
VLYLKFRRYLSYIFLALIVINLSGLIPMYSTGYPKDQEDVIGVAKLTIVNIWGHRWKIWITFIFVVVNGCIALYTVFVFWC